MSKNPDLAPETTAVSTLSDAQRRLLVTLAAVAAALLGRAIPLPGFGAAPGLGWQPAPPNILALGLKPIVVGFIGVELLSLLLPGWRRWRQFPLRGRARLTLRAEILGLFITLYLALGWTRLAAHGGQLGGFGGSALLSGGVMAISLLAGTAFLLLLARVIDRRGLGNGMAVLIAAPYLYALVAGCARALGQVGQEGGVTPLALALALLIPIAAGVATLRLLSSGSTANTGFSVAQPASGTIPLYAAGIMVRFAGLLAAIQATTLAGTLPFFLANLLLIALLGVICTRLFNPADAVAAARERALRLGGGAEGSDGGDPPGVLKQTLAYVLLLGAGGLLQLWIRLPLIPISAAALIAAVGLDIYRDWRARCAEPELVTAGLLHAPWQIGPLTFAARARGLRLHLRAAGARTLLHFFGPFVPIAVQVPPAEQAAAEELLAGLGFAAPESEGR